MRVTTLENEGKEQKVIWFLLSEAKGFISQDVYLNIIKNIV